MSDKTKVPTAEEIERERAIVRWNLYKAVQKRILNTFNDPRTLKPKYCFTAEVEEKCQRILGYAQEALPALIPLASEEMYSDSYQPPKVRITWRQRLMWWRSMGIVRKQPDGTWVGTQFSLFSRRDWHDLLTMLWIGVVCKVNGGELSERTYERWVKPHIR